MNPRPYQIEAVEATLEAWKEHRSALIVMATGLGKTVTFSEIINRSCAPAAGGLYTGGRAMVLAHREELVYQGAAKIEAVTGEKAEIEMAAEWADQHMFKRARSVVASVQSLQNGRLDRFNPDDFNTLVIDEAHHATAKSYRRVIDHFLKSDKPRILGVTATPDRGDEEALGQVFDHVAYVYEINDAVRDGWLVPIQQQTVIVEGLDFSNVRTTAGDLNGRDLAEIMEFEQVLHGIVHPTIEIAGDKRTLVFASSLKHAERLCEIFNRHRPDCARWVAGHTPKEDRRAMLADYAAGRFQYLVNVGVATEGFDEPGIEVVAIARPTKSRALYCQMVGRGTRPLPGVVDIEGADAPARRQNIHASTKQAVLVLDFVGNAGRHKLMTTADILGGKCSDEAVARAAANAQGAAGPVDMLDELEKAEKEIADEKQRDEEKRRAAIKAKANYKLQSVDPFDVLDIQPEKARGWDHVKKPTEKMRALLEANGIKTDELTFKAASQLIGEIINRRQQHLATFKQARFLRKHGVDAKGMTFEQASARIDSITNGQGARQPFVPEFAT